MVMEEENGLYPKGVIPKSGASQKGEEAKLHFRLQISDP